MKKLRRTLRSLLIVFLIISFAAVAVKLELRSVAAQDASSQETVTRFFSLLQQGDHTAAADLTVNYTAASNPKDVMSSTYASVLSYELLSSEHISRNIRHYVVRVTRLDAKLLLDGIAEETQLVLQKAVNEADSVETIYDNELHYLPGVVDNAFDKVLSQRLAHAETYTVTEEVVLETITENGVPRIIVNDEIYSILLAGKGAIS